VDDDFKVIGVVSEADLLTKEALDGGHRGTDPARFVVTVQDGIVTLKGKPENVPHGRDLVNRVGHVQGVVAVCDRLSYPPPERPVSPGPVF
jgi:hypothetical protein